MEAGSARDGDFERDGDFDFGEEAPRPSGQRSIALMRAATTARAARAPRARAGDPAPTAPTVGKVPFNLAAMFLASIACPSLTVRGGGGVLVVGSANVDLVAYAPRLPVSGETLAGLSFEQSPGGKGANQAVAAAKLGSDVRFITQLGEDSMGEGSLANYRAAGIDTTHIFRTSEAKTGVALITVNAESGDNTIVVCPGAAGLLDEAQLDAAADAFEQSSVLLTQLEVRARVRLTVRVSQG